MTAFNYESAANRAERQLEDDLNTGRITQSQFNDEIKANAAYERDEMEQAAQQAAQDVRDNW
jgi:hypothetical protein